MLRIGPPAAQPPGPQDGPPMPPGGAPGAPPGPPMPDQMMAALPKPSSAKYDAEKVSPDVARYMGPDEGPFMCGKCHHFDGQDGCEIVSGKIDPNGLCNLFESGIEGPDESAEPAAGAPEAGAPAPQDNQI